MSGPFKLRSGNASAFKNMGSSPARQNDSDTVEGAKRMVKKNQDLTVQDTIDSGSFNKAFAAARKSGAETFTYKGKSFTTKLAKKPPVASAGEKEASPNPRDTETGE